LWLKTLTGKRRRDRIKILERIKWGKTRRKAAGNFLVDISKYLLTAGLIARVVQKPQFTSRDLIIVVSASLGAFVVGIYAIPKEDE